MKHCCLGLCLYTFSAFEIMGIRFLCIHCEKRLNVKSTQVGQEGECTHCGQTVLVPRKSTIPSRLEKASRPLNQVNDAALTPQSSIVGQQVSSDAPSSSPSRLPSSTPSSSTTNTPSSLSSFELDKPSPPETLGKVDPIAEAPKRVWYFRSREIGEKGPLRGNAMREHVDQGDVTVGCIVWREDWEDWLPAEKVFPALAQQAKEMRQQDRVERAFKDANYKIPEEFDPDSKLNQKRRFRTRLTVAAIAFGILIIGLLIFVLIQLLSG